MTHQRTCPGCGALLQTTNPKLPGYMTEAVFLREGAICQRCFKLQHYGEYQKAQLDNEKLVKQLKERVKKSDAVFLLAECWNCDDNLGSLEWLENCNKPVYFLATKSDLINHLVSERGLLAWLTDATGLPPAQIRLISAEKGRSIPELRHFILDNYNEQQELLFVGKPNSGKSTLLNGLLASNSATSSPMPGTTVGFTTYKLEGGARLVDAPGVIDDAPLSALLCKTCLTDLTASRSISCYNTRLKLGQSLLLSGLVSLTLTELYTTALHVGAFASSKVGVHLTKADRVAELSMASRTDVVTPPCKNCSQELLEGKMITEEFELHSSEDIVFPELGWIGVYNGHGKGVIRYPACMTPRRRTRLIPAPKGGRGR